MSGAKGQPRADHRHAADQARQLPGQWILAATYNSRATAMSAAQQVRSSDRLHAYRPAGAFEARAELTQDGADLWVRYTDRDASSARDCAESIAAGLMESLDDFSRRIEAADTPRSTR